MSLLAEELNFELAKAIADKDMIKIADALCDIQYVLAGTIHEFGLGKKFKALFDEVHRSNMSKVCKSTDEALTSKKHYRDEGIACQVVQTENGWILQRLPDLKILKPLTYSPANLKAILTA